MGWYEDWKRQNLAFNPIMDQGSGEYTGYIKDVYEGDEAQRAWMPEFFPAPDQTTRKMMGDVKPGAVGVGNYSQMGDPKRGWGKLYNDTYRDAGANALIGAGANNVGVPDPLRERALGGAVAPGGPDAAAIVSGDASPGGWEQALGYFAKPNILSETVEGLGQSTGVGEVLTPAFQAADQFGNLITDAGKFDYMGADYGAMGTQLKKDLGPVAQLAGDAANTAVGYGQDLANYIGEQGRFTKRFWGDVYDEQLGDIKSWLSPTDANTTGAGVSPVITEQQNAVPSMFSSPGEAEVAGAVPTAIFPTDTSGVPFETPSESQTLRQAMKPYFDVDAGLSVGGGALAGLGTAKYVPKAVAGTYAAWKNMPSQQLKSLQSELDSINKTMADTEFLGPEQQKLKKRAAVVEGEMDKINSRVTGRQKAMNWAKGKMDAMKVTGGKLKRGATSAAKKGLVGLAYGAGATAVGAGVSLLISNMAFAAVPDAIESGHLPPDAEDWSEDDKVAAIYALSKTGEIPPDFANRFDMSQDAGGMISTVAGAIPDPISAAMAIADNEKNIRAHRTGTAFTGPEMWRQPLTRGANYPRGLF